MKTKCLLQLMCFKAGILLKKNFQIVSNAVFGVFLQRLFIPITLFFQIITSPLLSQDFIESFELFDTPNCLSPIYCWHGLGISPDGIVYIAASDHVFNSALKNNINESKG
jgi:hypothetical protein